MIETVNLLYQNGSLLMDKVYFQYVVTTILLIFRKVKYWFE